MTKAMTSRRFASDAASCWSRRVGRHRASGQRFARGSDPRADSHRNLKGRAATASTRGRRRRRSAESPTDREEEARHVRPVAEHDRRARAAELCQRVVGVHLHHERRERHRLGALLVGVRLGQRRDRLRLGLGARRSASAPRSPPARLSIAACSSASLRSFSFLRISASACSFSRSASCSSSSFCRSASFSSAAFCRIASCSPTSLLRTARGDLRRVVDRLHRHRRDLDVLAA